MGFGDRSITLFIESTRPWPKRRCEHLRLKTAVSRARQFAGDDASRVEFPSSGTDQEFSHVSDEAQSKGSVPTSKSPIDHIIVRNKRCKVTMPHLEDPLCCSSNSAEASFKDFFKLAPSGYSLSVPQEDKLLAWHKDVCNWEFLRSRVGEAGRPFGRQANGALPMDVAAPLYRSSSPRARRMRADRIETAYPWQTVSSLEDFMLFLDSKLNPAESEERKDWIFVLDFSESLAETIMTGQNIETAFGFSLKHLKKSTVTWAEQATLAIQGRPDLRKSAWKHVSWELDEDFALLVAKARRQPTLHHSRRRRTGACRG